MMKKFVLVGAVAGFVSVVAGCAAPSTKFQSESGAIFECSSAGFGVIGTPVALGMHADCVNKMQAKGYREVDSKSVAPPPSSDAERISLDLPAGWVKQQRTGAMVKGGGVLLAKNESLDVMAYVSVAERAGVQDLMAYATSRRANQEAALLNPQSTELEILEIGGRQAFRYEVAGFVEGGLKLTYFATIIVGEKELVMVNTWAKSIEFKKHKPLLESLASRLIGIS